MTDVDGDVADLRAGPRTSRGLALRRLALLAFTLLALLACSSEERDPPPAAREPAAADRLEAEEQGTRRTGAERLHRLPDGSSLAMIWVGSGRFRMGEGADAREVTLERGFWLAKHELTWAGYRAYCRATDRQPPTPDHEVTDQHPVHNVSWDDARAYCRWAGLRLPSEAEWEYACRAGSTSAYCYGDESGRLDEYAWYEDNAGGTSHPVGEKRANAWGFHDMHGNLWEWVEDVYTGYAGSSDRVRRGGGWDLGPRFCRSAFRNWFAPSFRFRYLGFRPAR